jgi:NAD dependent epimerase/dehydratase family
VSIPDDRPVLGTIHVLEAARLFDVRRIVYFSSIGVLPARQYEPIDQAHPIFLPRDAVPTGVYGASKIAGEAFCFAYNQAFGVDFRTIRPSAVYGFSMQWPIFVKPMVEGAVRGEKVTSSQAVPSSATTRTRPTSPPSPLRSSPRRTTPTASSTARLASRLSRRRGGEDRDGARARLRDRDPGCAHRGRPDGVALPGAGSRSRTHAASSGGSLVSRASATASLTTSSGTARFSSHPAARLRRHGIP